MILGQVSYSHRLANFSRPAQAGFYRPQLANNAFYSQLNPFPQAQPPMPSFRANIPNLPRAMNPNIYGQSMKRPFPSSQGFRPNVATMPGQIKGTLGHPPGQSPFSFIDTDPARHMRTGAPRWTPSTPAGIRSGVTQAGQLLQRLGPAQYAGAFRVAGGYR